MFEGDNIKDLLKGQGGLVDASEPSENHRGRFLEKLKGVKEESLEESKKDSTKKWWQYSVAAMLLLSVGLMMFKLIEVEKPIAIEVASSLPEEVTNATFHFEGLVKKELVKIELERNQDTNEIIDEAFKQLKVLETEQQNLQEQLKNHYDKRLVKALISNFQYRIQLLENVMQQIELTKEINTVHREII